MRAARTDGITTAELVVAIIVATVNTMDETVATEMESDEVVIAVSMMMEVAVANTMTAKETEETVVVIAVPNEGGINSADRIIEEDFICKFVSSGE